MILIIDCS